MKQKLRLRDSYALLITNQRNQSTAKLPSQTGGNSGMEGHLPHSSLPAKRNTEESCVCTHAKVSARSGLGLALGLMATLFLTTMCLYAVQPVSAQGAGPAATAVVHKKPLQIGDRIPEALWHLPLQVVNHPEGRDTITLNNFRSKKLIVLDFWATWCGSCLAAFPKMDSLQRVLEDEVEILLVNAKNTGDNLAKVEFLFDNRRNPAGEIYRMPTIVNDEVLMHVFPHKSIPHYVWISPISGVIGVTGSDQLTKANILGMSPDPEIQQDEKPFDASKANIEAGANLFKDRRGAHGRLSYLQPELPSVIGTKGSNGQFQKLYYINQPLLGILSRSFFPDRQLALNQILVDGTPYTHIDKSRHARLDASYCYELAVANPVSADSLYGLAKQDLAQCEGYSVRRSKMPRKAWLVTLASDAVPKVGDREVSDNNLRDKGVAPKYIRNQPIGVLIRALNNIYNQPFVDKTGLDGVIDLDLPADLSDWESLVKCLNEQGFLLSEQWVDQDLLIMTSKI